MNKEVITSKQGYAMIMMFLIGSAIVLSQGVQAKQDVWLAYIFAMVIAVPVNLIYARLLAIFPGMDLFDIVREIFGKVTGSIISLLYMWYAFHLGSLVMRNFSEFIQIISLQETPQYAIVAILGAFCIWYVKAGIEVMARWARFVSVIVLIVLMSIAALSLKEADFSNLQPFLYNGIQPVISSAYSIFSFPFGETIIFTMIFCKVKNKFNVYKVFLVGILLAAFILIIASIRNIIVLGMGTLDMLNFPSYAAVGLINIGNFLQRIEVVISVVFLLTGIVKIGVCLSAVCNGANKVFGLRGPQPIVAPICFLMMNLSCIIYSNTMEMLEWATKVYQYYAFPFQIILPILIWICGEFHKRKKRKRA